MERTVELTSNVRINKLKISNIKINFCSILGVMIVYFYLLESSFPISDNTNLAQLLFYSKFFLSFFLIIYSVLFSRRSIISGYTYCNKIQRLLVLPWFIILFCSVLSWTLSKPSFNFISRGISNFLYSIFAIMSGVSLYKIYGKRIVNIVAIAVCIMILTNYILGTYNNGMIFIAKLFDFTCEDSSILMYKELHEIAYICGILLLWSLYDHKNNLNIIIRLTLLLGFIFAFKRIGILAFLSSYIFLLFFKKIRFKRKNSVLLFFQIALFVVPFIYIYLVISGNFISLLNKFGINAMGRDTIYTYFSKFASFSPNFFGKGIGFVSRQFTFITIDDVGFVMYQLKQGLHNDFYRIYIEIGFIGTLLWLFYQCFVIPKIINNRYGFKSTVGFMMVLLFSFITYTTDNTVSYFVYQLVVTVLIINMLISSKKSNNYNVSNYNNRA